MSDGRDDRSYHTYREILSQPAAWRATLREVGARAADVRAVWQGAERPEVLFTGCGSPFFLARSAAAMYQAVAGAPAQAQPSSDLMLFPDLALADRRPRFLVAVSRSGETTEVLGALKAFAARDSGPALAITCYENTALERAAAFTLQAREAHEQSLAQTRSFTSMLLAAQSVAFALAGRPLPEAFASLPDACAALLDEHAGLAEQLGRDPSIERFFFLGGGPYYGLACEAMLKMKEMSLSYSEAYHFLEFRHGPMAMVNDRTLVVGMVSEAAQAHEAAVLAEMRKLGARVLAITPAELEAKQADYQVPLPSGRSDVERAALYLPFLQLMTFYRALHNNLNPDLPTNLNAVVHLDVDAIEARTS
jgi:glucosamine--fructose-6-phosphate aminotransferase (isomerizing)